MEESEIKNEVRGDLFFIRNLFISTKSQGQASCERERVLLVRNLFFRVLLCKSYRTSNKQT